MDPIVRKKFIGLLLELMGDDRSITEEAYDIVYDFLNYFPPEEAKIIRDNVDATDGEFYFTDLGAESVQELQDSIRL